MTYRTYPDVHTWGEKHVNWRDYLHMCNGRKKNIELEKRVYLLYPRSTVVSRILTPSNKMTLIHISRTPSELTRKPCTHVIKSSQDQSTLPSSAGRSPSHHPQVGFLQTGESVREKSQANLFSVIASPRGFPLTNPPLMPPYSKTFLPLTQVSLTRPANRWPSHGEQRFFQCMPAE